MSLNIHEEIRKNRIKSVFIIGMFFIFVALLGAAAGTILSMSYTGEIFNIGSILISVGVAVFVSLIYILIFMGIGSNMILSSTGAKEASREHYPHLYHSTEALSIAAGLRTPPKCYIIEDPSLNAYATGFSPEKSYVVVTTGLIKKLNRQELEGVIAHEIAHIKNYDIRIMLLAAGLVGATVFIADFLFRMFIFGGHGGGGGGGNKDGRIMIIVFIFYFILIITAPIVAQLIKLAISRQREYLADATGAELTRYPEGLASALEKIKGDPDPMIERANNATAHLFISNPFRKKKGGLSKLFSTHPPIEERIAILRGTKK
ncbi:MAG: M48 family metallopeptidase [Nanoarchaeota archaeon]|nr:M48 family metallopeptidase [Nanoarchaeota archaeon]